MVGLAKLAFNETLAKCASAELVRRLQALSKELVQLDQDHVDTSSLDGVSKDLIARHLLCSKDQSVRAHTACCLAELLRLYAPDAPYTGPELRDIFEFFIDQLKHMTGPSCANFHEYFHLIESLSNVKSAVLICEVPDAERIIERTFKVFFNLAKPDLPKNAVACLADILVQLIEEAQSLPDNVIDLILTQFLPKTVRSNPYAAALAATACNATSDKLQRYVAQYFTETILSATEPAHDAETSDEEAAGRSSKGKGKARQDPPSIADSEDFRTAHDLIKSINRLCPPLLTNVVPQLEEELLADDAGLRLLATRTLGDMFADKPLQKPGTIQTSVLQYMRSDVARRYPNTWTTWLGRSRDKVPSVRAAVLEAFRDILDNHHELARDIYRALRDKLMDPEEKIRAAACSAFQHIDYEAAIHSLGKDLLLQLSGRIRDRKPSVQREALTSLGRMFNNAYGEIANGSTAAISLFAWIPQEVVKSTALPEKELMALAERTMYESILPIPKAREDESDLVDRFHLIMQHLDVPAQKSLIRFTRLQENRPLIFEQFVNIAEKYNGGVVDGEEEAAARQLKLVCRYLAATLPDSHKAEEHLQKFAALNEKYLYKLLRITMDPYSDLNTILKSHAEFFRRLDASSPSLVETFSILVRRSSLFIINRSTLSQFLDKLIQPSDEEMQDSQGLRAASQSSLAETILETVSKHYPLLLAPLIPDLVKRLRESTDGNETEQRVVMHGLSEVIRAKPEAFQRDRKILDRAYDLAITGDAMTAKYAAAFLARVPDNLDQCKELVRDISDALPVASGLRLLAHLSVLKRLAKHAPEAYQARSEDITPYVLGLLKRDVGDEKMAGANGESAHALQDWCDDVDLLPEHQACVMVLKILTNRCLGIVGEETRAEKAATQTIMVMNTILTEGGRPRNFKRGPGLASRLRLQAAVSLLRLATVQQYDRLISTQAFQQLAWTIQDPAFQVRGALIHKLVAYTMSRKLAAPKYTCLLFLTAHDPDYENALMARRSIEQRARKATSETHFKEVDMLLARLIHLLAHHPDFHHEVEDLKFFVKYIEFFLDCLASKENIAAMYLVASKVKSIRDSETQGHSENLYIVSELAQYVIRSRAKLHSWSLDAPPIHVRMPGDIFKPLPNKETESEIQKRVYLPDEFVEALGSVGKAVKLQPKAPKAPAEKKRKLSPTARKVKVKSEKASSGDKAKTTKQQPRQKSKGKAKKHEWEESDEEEDTAGESSSDEDLQAYEDELAAEEATSSKNGRAGRGGKSVGSRTNGNDGRSRGKASDGISSSKKQEGADEAEEEGEVAREGTGSDGSDLTSDAENRSEAEEGGMRVELKEDEGARTSTRAGTRSTRAVGTKLASTPASRSATSNGLGSSTRATRQAAVSPVKSVGSSGRKRTRA